MATRAEEAHHGGWPAEATGLVRPELIEQWPGMIPATKAERALQVRAMDSIRVRERVADARVFSESANVNRVGRTGQNRVGFGSRVLFK